MPRTHNKINVYACGSLASEAIAWLRDKWSSHARSRLVVLTNRLGKKPPASDSYVVCHRRDFDEWSLHLADRLSSRWRVLILNEKGPLEPIIPQLMRLRIRDERRIHVARLAEDGIRSYLRRFIETVSRQNTDNLILDAAWKDDTLVVVSPTFERLNVPLHALPAKVRTAHHRRRNNLEIDEYGEYIYWPDLDVHMGWSQLEQAVDPEARLRAAQRSKEFNERYGKAIRTLRERQRPRLNQSDIKGLTERTVRRIEKGQTRATTNAIKKLAKAHKMTPSEYMNALAELLEEVVTG